MGAIMYNVSDVYIESQTDRGSPYLFALCAWSRRLIVAVFIHWRRVCRVAD